MTDKITAAAALKLGEAFEQAYPVYAADVQQGLQTPCFLIQVSSVTETPWPGGRVRTDWILDIAFYPEDPADNPAMLAVAGTALAALAFTADPDGKQYYGRNRAAAIRDGVLHISVTYSVICCVAEETDLMEELAGAVNTAQPVMADADTAALMETLEI